MLDPTSIEYAQARVIEAACQFVADWKNHLDPYSSVCALRDYVERFELIRHAEKLELLGIKT